MRKIRSYPQGINAEFIEARADFTANLLGEPLNSRPSLDWARDLCPVGTNGN